MSIFSTIKGRIYRWFSDQNRLDWTSVLSEFLSAINNTKNRVTGLPPNKIDEKNATEIWERVYGQKGDPVRRKGKLRVGDSVRALQPKQIFDKGYFPNFSDHIYTVAEAHTNTEPFYYRLKDHDEKLLKRKYYRSELVKVRVDGNTSYRIERIVKEKKDKKGKKSYLVTFVGYPNDKYWINEEDFA